MTQRFSMFALILVIFISLLALWLVPTKTSPEFRLSKGRTVYVSAYSNVFIGPHKLPYPLATTLSIRSTDFASSFQVTSIDYYDKDGKLLKRYLEKPLNIGPMASSYVHIDERYLNGGFGANFIVRWKSNRIINNPIIECVMIGASSGHGISFVSPGQEIKE